MSATRRHVAGRSLLFLLFAVVVAACYGAPGAGPGSVEPATSVFELVVELPTGETAGPITYPPDNMWTFLASMGEGMRRADTLAGAIDFAELIVVGRYVGIERGPKDMERNNLTFCRIPAMLAG